VVENSGSTRITVNEGVTKVSIRSGIRIPQRLCYLDFVGCRCQGEIRLHSSLARLRYAIMSESAGHSSFKLLVIIESCRVVSFEIFKSHGVPKVPYLSGNIWFPLTVSIQLTYSSSLYM